MLKEIITEELIDMLAEEYIATNTVYTFEQFLNLKLRIREGILND